MHSWIIDKCTKEQENWWLCFRPYIQEMTLTDCMCKLKRKRRLASIEDCVDASIHGLKDNIKKSKERLITAATNNTGIIRTTILKSKIANRNGKKNNSTDISSDKLVRFLTRRRTYGNKRDISKEKMNLLIATQNNTIRTNYIKAKINNTQQNSKCRLCEDKDERVNNTISECSKLIQKKYQAMLYNVGKVINWELCKKLKFDHITKWYMYKPESAQENEMHKILWNFEIRTDHLIPPRWPNLVVIKKKIRFAVLWILPWK